MPIPKIVVTAALMAAQMAIGASRKIQGPRLENTKVTVAEYGTPIPRFWGIRKFEAIMPHAEEITVRKKKSKTKGGKYSEDRGYGTWMSLICDHEIDAVSRIWFDDRLVYDATGSGPISAGSALSGLNGGPVSLGSNMRLYLGTEDQLPDPRYEAWCEDRYGPDSAPAYRGSAYVFFEDIPLANFGNRIPNVTIEAISNKADIYPKVVTESDVGVNDDVCFSVDGSRMLVTNQNNLWEIWDTETQTMLMNGTHGFIFTGVSAYSDDGRIYTGSEFQSYVSDSDFRNTIELENPEGSDTNHAYNASGTICFTPWFDTRDFAVHVEGGVLVETTIGYNPSHYFADLDDNVWAVGDGASAAELYCIKGDRGGDSLTVATGENGIVYGVVNSEGEAVLFQNNVAFRVDLSDGSIIDSAATNGATKNRMAPVKRGDLSLWLGNKKYSLTTLEELQSINLANWGYPGENADTYVPACHAVIEAEAEPGNDMRWLFLDRVSNAGVTLQTIVNDVSDWCGVSGVITTALTQEIDGYSVSQGSGKDMISPLLDIHDVDARPHDDALEFKVRGSSSGGTILTQEFVREGDEARYVVELEQDTDLPRRVTVNFADANADQQVNTAISQRPLDATDSHRDETIDLSTYVATPDDAQQLSDRRHRRIWNEREKIKNSLTAQYLALEPGDVRTVNLDGSPRIARLDRMTAKGSVLACEWIRDHPSLHTLNGASGAELEGRNPETIYLPPQVRGFVVDGPLAADADNDVNPVIYVGVGSYGGTVLGATMWRGDDGTYDEAFADFGSSSEATWGFADEALDDANPNLWDRGNTLDVTIFGTLTSSTEAAIDIDPSVNLIAIGQDDRWEYLNFVTATLTGTSGSANTYTLSGFKRGRRGTEGNTGNHENGDLIVVLSQLAPVEIGTDEFGNDMSFKAQVFGRDVDAAPANDLTYDGNTLKPYAPVVWHVTKDPTSGDITIELRSRTRIGGTWNGSTIPTGETIESYEFDVYRSGDFKRTLTSSTKTLTYSSSDQTTDGGSIAASALDGFAYQLSATVGRGFAQAA